MAKVMREPGDGYWSERAALEHKATRGKSPVKVVA
jgi:hypothetical protein